MQLHLAGNTRGREPLLAGMLIMAWCSAASAQQFAITDLGSLGGPMAGAFGINANRFVVGYSVVPNVNLHGFMWDGVMHELAPLAGDTQSHAFAINALGAAVGVSYVLGGLTSNAMLWQQGSGSLLGSFAPRGVNDAGTVVGCASSAINLLGWIDQACVLKSGNLVTLPTLGGSFSYAFDVNASDQIVGTAFLAGLTTRRACLWQNGQAIDLGTLGGNSSQAYAINDAGQVVGVADTGGGVPHAFLYALSPQGQVLSRTDLGELGGGYSYAYGVSGLGEVVGTSDSRAFYWYHGVLWDLASRTQGASGWSLNNAAAINDRAEIVGQGTYQGWPHAFLLTPLAPDFDHDGDVDSDDFAHLQRCYGGGGAAQTPPECRDALLDGNDSVDLNDFLIFQKCASGPGVPADPACWR